MRKMNMARKGFWRRTIALALLCGLLVPMLPRADAVKMRYAYTEITSESNLPRDNQWHDFFIAWENGSKINYVDFEFFDHEGDSSYIDHSGWIEIISSSDLKSAEGYEAKSFLSDEKLGAMQIKYVGTDSDNGDAPMYLIRVLKQDGTYRYFEDGDLEPKQEDSDSFTFQRVGNYFNIFVNRAGADKYLIRDGSSLESNESTTASESECRLMVWQREESPRPTTDNEVSISGSYDRIVNGKAIFYEYNRITTHAELMELTKNNGWQDILIAWVDTPSEKVRNEDTVYYSCPVWLDSEGKANYWDHWRGEGSYYYSNKTLGSDRYSSAQTENFITQDLMTNFQIKYHSMDGDNTVQHGENKGKDSPRFYIRFSSAPGRYAYFAKTVFKDESEAKPYTFHINENPDSVHYQEMDLFLNASGDLDTCVYHNGNMLATDWPYDYDDDWSYYFRVYSITPTEYDAIVEDIVLENGATMRVDKNVVLADGVTITVKDGGYLVVNRRLFNTGHIVVEPGGTVVIDEGGEISPLNPPKDGGTIHINGGNVVVLENGKLFCDHESYGDLIIENGGSLVNLGVVEVQRNLTIKGGGSLLNEQGGMVIHGMSLVHGRSSANEMTAAEILSYSAENWIYRLSISEGSVLRNRGTYVVGGYNDCFNAMVSEDSIAYNERGGRVQRGKTSQSRNTGYQTMVSKYTARYGWVFYNYDWASGFPEPGNVIPAEDMERIMNYLDKYT